MSRLRLGIVMAAILGIGLAPASAAESYKGTGVVTGTVDYGRTLPGTMQACAFKLPVEVRLSSPAFALTTPTGVRLVPLAVSAIGVAWCESESTGGASMDVTIEAGPLRCEIRGGYTRVASWMQFIASDRYCAVDEDGDGTAEATANGYSWLFELSYVNRGILTGTVLYQPY